MEYKITGYRPEKLFHFFEEISAIPRGSGNEQEISDYLVRFAKERGLWVCQDEAKNVIIRKEAGPGSEDRPPVMLQGHLDMVCDRRAGTSHDFEKDGIRLVVTDGVLSADGTTLGADNGAAVALMMTVLDSTELKHPPLECVFTTEEETGLKGAKALDKSLLKARTMINLDSEEEDTATVSCAGGLRIRFTKPARRKTAKGTLLEIRIEGLLGGHSGSDIDKERQNADLLMARIADDLIRNTGAELVSFDGGTKDNAIPRECTAVFLCRDRAQAQEAEERAGFLERQIAEEVRGTEPEFSCRVRRGEETEARVLSREDAEAFLGVLRLAPNGVLRRRGGADGFVIASSNLGIVRTRKDRLELLFSPRSSSESIQSDTKERFRLLADTFGFETVYSGEYPGWEYREHSRIREIFQESYRELTGKELNVEAIHAGLECGIFVGALPGLDAISVGPTLYNVHTPDECMPLDSLERFWRLLADVLARLAEE